MHDVEGIFKGGPCKTLEQIGLIRYTIDTAGSSTQVKFMLIYYIDLICKLSPTVTLNECSQWYYLQPYCPCIEAINCFRGSGSPALFVLCGLSFCSFVGFAGSADWILATGFSLVAMHWYLRKPTHVQNIWESTRNHHNMCSILQACIISATRICINVEIEMKLPR